MTTPTTPPAFTKEAVQEAVDAILNTLGKPETDLHREALTAFQQKNYPAIKRLSSTHLGDFYCKSLGYLGSAFKLTPNTDTILAESARAAADFTREQELKKLSLALANALN